MSPESRRSSITSGWSRPTCGNHCSTRLCWLFCCSIASWCGSPKREGRSRQPLGAPDLRKRPKPERTRLPIVLEKTFLYNPGLEASYRSQECRMNPFSGRSKGAARAAMAVVAITTLSLAVGCGFGGGGGGGGGGGNTGFSNAILNGQYVFSQKGLSITQDLTAVDFFSEGGVFTADGNG